LVIKKRPIQKANGASPTVVKRATEREETQQGKEAEKSGTKGIESKNDGRGIKANL